MTRTWAQVSARAGRNDWPALLARAALIDADPLDEAELPYAITRAWLAAEWPLRCLDAFTWLTLFECAGAEVASLHYISDDDGDDDERVFMAPKAELPDPMTLWRGAMPDGAAGMSWTEDRSRAQWFARRFGDGPQVYRADIHPDFVLAQIRGRGEAEYVIHPDAFEGNEPVIDTTH